MTTIPESHRELLSGPYFAVFTTIAPDGGPENTVVWAALDGDTVLVGTAADRRKSTNISENPNVAICVLDPKDPFNWIDVRGTAEIVPDENYEVVDLLAKIYTGEDTFYGGVQPAENAGKEDRVVIRITPDRVVTTP
jgi:PPOX class probable F420-dependent enzyme